MGRSSAARPQTQVEHFRAAIGGVFYAVGDIGKCSAAAGIQHLHGYHLAGRIKAYQSRALYAAYDFAGGEGAVALKVGGKCIFAGGAAFTVGDIAVCDRADAFQALRAVRQVYVVGAERKRGIVFITEADPLLCNAGVDIAEDDARAVLGAGLYRRGQAHQIKLGRKSIGIGRRVNRLAKGKKNENRQGDFLEHGAAFRIFHGTIH